MEKERRQLEKDARFKTNPAEIPPEQYNRYCDSLSDMSEDDSWDDNEEFGDDDYYDEEEAS